MAYTLSFGSIMGKVYPYSSTIQIAEAFMTSFPQFLTKATFPHHHHHPAPPPPPSFWPFLMLLDRGPWKDCQDHCGKNPKEKVTGLTPPTPWSPSLISVSQTRHTFMRHYSDFPLHSQEEKTLKPG